MFMKKVIGKKGDTNWVFLSLILGLVVVVVVVLFVTGGFGKISDVLDKVSDVEIIAQACGGYADAGLVNSYCNEFHKTEILGVKQWVTCEYLKDKPGVTFDAIDEGCTGSQEDLAKKRCETLKDNERVNGEICWDDNTETTDWGCSKSKSTNCPA
jgi:hypothetical protein